MSWPLVKLVWERYPSENAMQKAVLMALADQIREDRSPDECFPSLATLGFLAGCRASNVRRCLRDLQRLGFVVALLKGKVGGWKVEQGRHYRLNLAALEALEKRGAVLGQMREQGILGQFRKRPPRKPDTPSSECRGTPSSECAVPLHKSAATPSKDAPAPLHPHEPEPLSSSSLKETDVRQPKKTEPEKAKSSRAARSSGEGPDPAARDIEKETEAVLAHYRRVAGSGIRGSIAARGHIANRLQEGASLQTCREVVEHAVRTEMNSYFRNPERTFSPAGFARQLAAIAAARNAHG